MTTSEPKDPTPWPSAGVAPDFRWPWLDAGRILAILGVIWIHVAMAWRTAATGDTTRFGRFGVPFFTASAILLAVKPSGGRPFLSFVGNRARRVLLPWLVWTVIYGLLKLVEARFLGRREADSSRPWYLTGNTAYHLWFLPFIFMVSLLSNLVRRAQEAIRCPGLVIAGIGWIVTAGLLAAESPRWGDVAARIRMDTELPHLIWCPAYIAFGILMFDRREAFRDRPGLAAIGGAILLGSLGAVAAMGSTTWATGLAGLGLLLACVCLPSANVSPALTRAGALSFGIYLIHVLVVHAFKELARRVHLRDGYPQTALQTVLVFLASWAAALVLNRWKRTRWMVS